MTAPSTMTGHSAGRKANLAERIYLQLKQDIFDFRLAPGDRFSENDIAERMHASRTPVREALFRLQREHYVEVIYRSGWQVRPFDFTCFEELYDVRIILECAAVQTLCDQQQQNTIRELASLWCVSASEQDKHGPTVCEMDERFHQQLVAAAGNREMARIHTELTERLRIIRRLDFTAPARIDATYKEHAALLDAVLQRRRQHAQKLLREHIEASRNEVRKITLHMLQQARARGHQQAANSPPGE